MKGYYFITDAGLSRSGIVDDARKAIGSGTSLIQYREKSMDTLSMYREALAIKEACGGTGSKLIINDRIDVALAVGADGVHIGQEDMPYEIARRLLGPGKIIGVTVHSVEEAVEAERMGADYLGVSPIYRTTTKADAGEPGGIKTLREVRGACSIPIAAIGGITMDTIDEVIDAGADMICAIQAVVASHDVAGEIRKIQRRYGL